MVYDAIILGGSFAGLSAGMQLARAGREVCIIYSGKPSSGSVRDIRNLPDRHQMDTIGTTPSDLVRYPSLRTVDGVAVEARREYAGCFRVTFDSGESRVASKLLLAFGQIDGAFALQLGCAIDDGPLGRIIRTNADMMTTIPGVYATGNVARFLSDSASALTDGVLAGSSIDKALISERTTARQSE